MMKPFSLAAAFAALCIGFSAPTLASEDVGDPSMKFFYPDGSIQWEEDYEHNRHFDRMERERKQPKKGAGEWKDPDRQPRAAPSAPGSAPTQGQP